VHAHAKEETAMARDYTIGVGAVGGGLSFSHDGGDTWQRIRFPLPSECNVRALRVYPDNAQRILAGTDVGLYRSEDNGMSWEKLDSPMEDLQIWSVAVDPVDTDTIFVGTRPEGFRSKDSGKTWDKLYMGVNLNCPIGTPRTTNIIVDPRDHRTIWAGIEVDGIYKSLDSGETWVHLPDLGPDPFHGDIHGMAMRVGPTTAVFATSPFGIATSTDEGESWDYHYFPKFREDDVRSYCRGMAIKEDAPEVLFVGNGDFIPGDIGAIQISRDGGQTWKPAPLPTQPNSVVYWFATHPELPDVIVAASLYGYVYVSEDGGDSWTKLKKEFGEVRSLALTPN
jgi:photosystem II stability/assembly factor-like uncharacterized protein